MWEFLIIIRENNADDRTKLENATNSLYEIRRADATETWRAEE